jgi:hypothetical protein
MNKKRVSVNNLTVGMFSLKTSPLLSSEVVAKKANPQNAIVHLSAVQN